MSYSKLRVRHYVKSFPSNHKNLFSLIIYNFPLLFSQQVGACIVNEENKIVGIGYNGMPNGCNDDEFPWGKDSVEKHKSKYMYGKMFLVIS